VLLSNDTFDPHRYHSELLIYDVGDIYSPSGPVTRMCVSDRTLKSTNANLWVDTDGSVNAPDVSTLPTCFTGVSYRDLSITTARGTTSVTTMHPVVQTQCHSSDYLRSDGGNHTDTGNYTKIAYLHDNGTSLGILFDFNTLNNQISNLSGPSSVKDERHITYYPPIWTESPEPGSSSLIGVFPYLTTAAEKPPASLSQAMASIDFQDKLSTVVCTTLAYWNNGELQLIGVSGLGTLQTGTLPISVPHNARRITLEVANIASMQSPQFVMDLFRTSVFLDSIGYTLSQLLAIAISNVPDSGYVHLEDEIPPGFDARTMSTFKFTTVVYGYGYGNTSISVRLAMAVMVTYCVVTVAYIAYILITGSTSTAWNSGIELVALALQSRKPNHLDNSGVGIDSIKTFQEGVGIRVNQDDGLELVFAHDRDIDKRGLGKLERNVEY
jgi:hypothetical protein